MSKELTEQFFKATLKAGTYYVLNDDGIVDIDYYGGDNFQWNVIKEVLAPVPSYDEWEELQEASDGLSKIMFKSLMDRFVKADEEREKLEQLLESETLAKQEGVEIVAELEYRLKEAEKVIKKYAYDDFEYCDMYYEKDIKTGERVATGLKTLSFPYAVDKSLAQEYLEKYGVEK